MNDNNTNNSIIIADSTNDNVGLEPENPAELDNAFAFLPRILVAMNIAFSLTTDKNVIDGDKSDTVEDVPTDASLKRGKANKSSLGTKETVPTTITATNLQLPKCISDASMDSFDSLEEENGNDSSDDKNETWKLKQQIHDLRLDMQHVQPDGLAGKILFWWLYPVKWVADPGTFKNQN